MNLLTNVTDSNALDKLFISGKTFIDRNFQIKILFQITRK